MEFTRKYKVFVKREGKIYMVETDHLLNADEIHKVIKGEEGFKGTEITRKELFKQLKEAKNEFGKETKKRKKKTE